eukprot:m.134124 g.134124  ORF g.134124 m.134124 type:complete len:97 (-) comp17552_c0_seq4:287-577(-)
MPGRSTLVMMNMRDHSQPHSSRQYDTPMVAQNRSPVEFRNVAWISSSKSSCTPPCQMLYEHMPPGFRELVRETSDILSDSVCVCQHKQDTKLDPAC